jgi:hypothetical protein
MVEKISVFFNGMPEFENLFRISVRLKERGQVEPVCYVPAEVVWREPRLRKLIAESPLSFTVRPNRLFKVMPGRYLSRADANLTLLDPLLDDGPNRRRSAEIRNRAIRSILVQHGVIQRHIAIQVDRDDVDYHSDRLLTFEPLMKTTVLSDASRRKVRSVGFIKPVLFPPRPPLTAMPSHDRVILLCHSFRWEGRYGDDDIERFFDMVQGYAARHPRDLLIVRGHRGKIRRNYRSQTRALGQWPNVVVSHAYEGPLKGMSMTDVLALSDLCISSVSTAILDSIYMGLPTATYENDQKVFRSLCDICDLETMERFVEAPDTAGVARILDHYGAIDVNIERACDEIETCLSPG